MERAVKTTYRKKEFWLRLPARVEFDMCEQYKLENILDIFEIQYGEGMLAVLDLLKRMSAAGGEAIEFDKDMSMAEYLALKTAAVNAVVEGIRREVLPDEIDEGLLELEKKKVGKSREHTSWFYRVIDSVFRKKKPTTPRPE